MLLNMATIYPRIKFPSIIWAEAYYTDDRYTSFSKQCLIHQLTLSILRICKKVKWCNIFTENGFIVLSLVLL